MTQTSLVRTSPKPATENGRAWGVIALEALTAIAAAYGGFGLIWDDAVGMPDDWLVGTPFRSWTLPGVLLLLVVGLPMAVAVVLELRRSGWAGVASVVAGAALIGWIAVELLVMQKFNVLQPVMLLVGLAVLMLALWDWRHRPLLLSRRDAGS